MKKTLILSAIAAVLMACVPQEKMTINVIPYPNDVKLTSGTFDACGAAFHYSAGFDEATQDIIRGFAGQLSLVSGCGNAVEEGSGCEGFTFTYDPDIAEEAYSLDICRNVVKVKASSLRGVNYAVQTIKQMLPVEIYADTQAAGIEWTLPCAVINDSPRFRYRGQHLDEARHFYGAEEVKKILDLMEIHKMNTLHWHLTDDQGWRVEIKKYPKLTEVGSIRKETLVGHVNWSNEYDGIPYGEGLWYTQEQIRDVIGYAASKGITIIPEIDLPGHMLAALTAYPEFGCTGGPYDVWGRWGIAEEVLCAGNEKTMTFLEDVLSEVADLFPAEYIHIGGDECPKVRWEKCPHCQAKIRELGLKDDDRFDAEHYLQSYVMKRMSDFLIRKGKKVIGWDEILEGDVAENAVVMSWRGTQGGVQAANLGLDAIMTPNTYCYIDYYQALDIKNEPLGQGGYLPVEKVYSYEPFIDKMTDQEKKHIIGVQTNLWTEYIPTAGHLEYMLLPRMSAITEVQWCLPENKNWERFRESADHLTKIYDQLDFKYAPHIFYTSGHVSIDKEKNVVLMHFESQGNAPVRYTIDGTEPTPESALYTGPVEVTGDCIVKGKAFRKNLEDKVFSKEFHAHKAMGKAAVLGTEPVAHYRYTAPDLLTDGVRGDFNFRSGAWAGWRGEPIEMVVDMQGETYSHVTLSALVIKYDYIFHPDNLTISTSDNGTDFTEVASASYPIEGENDPNGPKEYSLDFPETSARYLKVVAGCVESLPEWHSGNGHPGFVFVDEIIVK